MTTFLESVALRSFVILLLTTLAATLYRHRSAAVLHRIWTLGLIGCLLVPAVSLISPAWELAVLPAQVSNVSPLEPQSLDLVDRSSDRTSLREVSRPQLNHRSHEQRADLNSPASSPVDIETKLDKADVPPIAPSKTAAVEAFPPASTLTLSTIIHWTWLAVAGLLGRIWVDSMDSSKTNVESLSTSGERAMASNATRCLRSSWRWQTGQADVQSAGNITDGYRYLSLLANRAPTSTKLVGRPSKNGATA